MTPTHLEVPPVTFIRNVLPFELRKRSIETTPCVSSDNVVSENI